MIRKKKQDPELEEADTKDGEEPEAGEKKKKLSGKKIVLFIGAPILVIVLGLGAAFFLGFFGGGEEHAEDGHEEQEAKADPAELLVFYDLPEMLVNLNTNGQTATYLKLKVAIELEDASQIAVIEPLMPRVVDRFQVYLRQLRVADLSGSAGMYHLKTELMRRINASVPVEVKDVLFKEMIIQ